MSNDLISHESRRAFARVGAAVMGGGFELHYFPLREETARLGIQTAEVLETTWAGRRTESLPDVERFQDYYNTINWKDRDDVARILPALEKIIAAVRGHFDQKFLNDIVSNLESDGLRINPEGRICKAHPSSLSVVSISP